MLNAVCQYLLYSLYLGRIVADGSVGSSAGPHGKAYDLPFDEDEKQHEHLKTTRDTTPSQMRLVRDLTCAPKPGCLAHQAPVCHDQDNINSR